MSRIALPFAALFALSLSACTPPADTTTAADSATSPADSSAPADTATPPAQAVTPPVADVSKVCDASKVQGVVGQVASQDVIDKAVADSGSAQVRVIKPGEAVTMDFLEERLNLEVDEGNVIKSVRCG